MKKLLFLFITLGILASSVSCKDDDSSNDTQAVDPKDVSEADIVGKWSLVGYKLDNGKSTTEVQGQKIVSDYTVEGSKFDYTTEFKTDPKIATSEGTFELTTVVSVAGQTSTQVTPANTNDTPGLNSSGWKIEGNQLITMLNEATSGATIKELSANKLVLDFDLSKTDFLDFSGGLAGESGSIEIEGFNVTVSGNVILTYTK